MKDKQIPALRKSDNSVHWIRIGDICFSGMEDRRLVFHTKDDVYYQISQFDQLLLLFTPEEGFEKLDRGIVVQMDNLKQYDSTLGLLYFDEETVGNDVKYATVAPKYLPTVKKALGKGKDVGKPKGKLW